MTEDADRPPGQMAFADRDSVLVQAGRDVIVTAPGPKPAESNYNLRVEEIDGRNPELVGRETDLEFVAGFLRGGTSYLVIEGRPWAGKTAFAARIAVDPPPDTEVVSFFVSRRDGTARLADYRQTAGEQLAALCGIAAPDRYDGPTLIGLWRRAAAEVRGRGKRLLLIVDGLDEDGSRDEGRPSIASQLPVTCPDGSRVMVTSRSLEPLPPDVPAGHPIAAGERRRIEPYPTADDVERAARADLDEHLQHRDRRRVLTVLAVAGRPLSADDLADVEQVERFGVQVMVEQMARVLESRHLGGDITFAFQHDALLTVCEQRVGRQGLAAARESIDAWARRYQEEGWPDSTPNYLIFGYQRHLMTRREIGMLVRNTSAARIRLTRKRTGRYRWALREADSVLDLLTREPQVTASELARLSLYRAALRRRNELPTLIPYKILALLGEIERAEQFALGHSEPDRQATALGEIAGHLGGDAPDTARRLFGEANHLLAEIGDAERRTPVLVSLARNAARAGQDQVAMDFANLIDNGAKKWPALAGIAEVHTSRQRFGEADRILNEISDNAVRFRERAKLATSAARDGGMEFAVRLVADLRREIGAEVSDNWTARTEAMTCAAVGDLQSALDIVHRITDPEIATGAFLRLVSVAADRGDSAAADRAFAGGVDRLIRAGRPMANDIAEMVVAARRMANAALVEAALGDLAQNMVSYSSHPFGPILAGVALRRLVEAGMWWEAVALAQQFADPKTRSRVVALLVNAMADQGLYHEARRVALLRGSGNDDYGVQLSLEAIVESAAKSAEVEIALHLLEGVSHLSLTASCLLAVAEAAAVRGDKALARELLGRADAAAEKYEAARNDPYRERMVKEAVIAGLLSARRWDEAARLVDPTGRSRGRVRQAEASDAVRAGRLDDAERILASLSPSAAWAVASDLAVAYAAGGDYSHAELLISRIDSESLKARSLARMSMACQRSGAPGQAAEMLGRAERLALTEASWSVELPLAVAEAARQSGDPDCRKRLLKVAFDRAVAEPKSRWFEIKVVLEAIRPGDEELLGREIVAYARRESARTSDEPGWTTEIIGAAVRMGRPDQAYEVIAGTKAPFRESALRALVGQLARQGLIVDAERVVGRAEAASRAAMVAEAAIGAEEAGKTAAADRLLSGLDAPAWIALVLSAQAVRANSVENTNRAREKLSQLSEVLQRHAYLRLPSGPLARAVKVARSAAPHDVAVRISRSMLLGDLDREEITQAVALDPGSADAFLETAADLSGL